MVVKMVIQKDIVGLREQIKGRNYRVQIQCPMLTQAIENAEFLFTRAMEICDCDSCQKQDDLMQLSPNEAFNICIRTVQDLGYQAILTCEVKHSTKLAATGQPHLDLHDAYVSLLDVLAMTLSKRIEALCSEYKGTTSQVLGSEQRAWVNESPEVMRP